MTQTFPGYGGHRYDSKLEAEASFALAGCSIVRDASTLPIPFRDADGKTFNAKADFIHPPTGIRFELKGHFLNSTKTQATAESQYEASRTTSDLWRKLRFSWSNSAVKLHIVQGGIATSGRTLIPVFWSEPDEETRGRLRRNGTFWLVYGSRGWRQLMAFLKLAAHGLACSLTFRDDAGNPLHEFR
jgi:hypothetical protein